MTAIRVCVCDCTQGNRTSRFPVQVSQLNGKTESLFSEIAKQIGSSENEFEIFYCGQKLERDVGLETFNLTPQSTLFVFRKKQQAEADKGTSGQTSGEMMPLINRAVQQPNYRKTVDHILTNQDSLQKLLAAVPGLDNDPIAMSMLQDPELLQILVHRQNFFSVMKKHPLFEKAAAYVAGIVNEEHARDPARAVRSNVYSMDQMSDDEDEGNQRGATARPPQQQITASQLAAALAAATASAAAHPSTSASSSSQQGAAGGSSGSGSNTSVISPDFFQQAMMTAQSSALETQLQQLRDMGISDENVARRALTATGGDLQAALELIFGDGVQ